MSKKMYRINMTVLTVCVLISPALNSVSIATKWM